MQPCNCCDGTTAVVPVRIYNRPGLQQFRYQIGTYETFRESMVARLNRICVGEQGDCDSGQGLFPLRDRLKTRKMSDPSLAFIEAWAAVTDVLTFYQERIANEGFLGTAIQPRSLDELSRLVGYQPRPGLSASALVAFDVEEPEIQNGADKLQTLPSGGVLIPEGTAVESTPAPGTIEQPQTFETIEEIIAFQAWNNIPLRKTRPPQFQPRFLDKLYLKGVGLGLVEGDYLYATVGQGAKFFVHRIRKITENPELESTLVEFAESVLSAARLMETLRRQIEGFPGLLSVQAVPPISATQPDFVQTAKKRLTDLIGKSAPDQYSIARIDEYFCQQVIARELSPPLPGRDTIVSISDSLLAWAKDLVKRASHPDGVFRSKALTQPYKFFLRNAIREDFFQPQETVQRYLGTRIADRTSILHQIEKTLYELTRQLRWAVIVTVNPQPLPITAAGPEALMPDVQVFAGDAAPSIDEVVIEIVESVTGAAELVPGSVSGWAIPPLSGWQKIVATHTNATAASIQSLLASVRIQSTEASGMWQIEIRCNTAGKICCGFAAITVFKGAMLAPLELIQRPLQILPLEAPLRPLAQFPETPGTSPPVPAWIIKKDGDDLNETSASGATTSAALQKFAPQLSAEPGLRVIRVRCNFPITAMGGGTNDQWWRIYVPMIGISSNSRGVFLPPQTLRSLEKRTLSLHTEVSRSTNADLTDSVVKYLLDVGSPLVDDALESFEVELDVAEQLPSLSSAAVRKETVVQGAKQTIDPSGSTPAVTARTRLEELELILNQVDDDARSQLRDGVEDMPPAPFTERCSGELESGIKKLLADEQQAPNLAQAATLVEQFENDFKRMAEEIESRFSQLRAAVTNVRDGILASLRDVRLEFLAAVQEATARHEANGTAAGITMPTEIAQQVTALRAGTDLDVRQHRMRALASLVRERLPLSAPDPDSLAAELLDLLSRVDPAPPALPQPKVPALQDLLAAFPSDPTTWPAQIDAIAAQSLPLRSSDIQQLLARLSTALSASKRRFFFDLLASKRITDPQFEPKIFALPTQTNIFGWNAPPKEPGVSDVRVEPFTNEIMANMPTGERVPVDIDTSVWGVHTVYHAMVDISAKFIELVRNQISANILKFLTRKNHVPCREVGDAADKLFLDGEFRNIKPGDVIALRKLSYQIAADPPTVEDPQVFIVKDVRIRPRTAYDLRGNTTEVYLNRGWWSPFDDAHNGTVQAFEDVKQTRVFCEARRLTLAEEPFEQPSDREIVCDTLVDHLEAGQQLVIMSTPEFGKQYSSSQQESELITVEKVTHEIDSHRYNDRYVTHIHLAGKLRQRRFSGEIKGNLAKVTHGKTVVESVGDGQGNKSFLKHHLDEMPLSRLAAPTPNGFRNALSVQVNNVTLDESPSLAEPDIPAQSFVACDDFAHGTTLIFGDGKKVARTPTGVDNIKAKYRVGVGIAGNVAERRIDQLSGSPIGVKSVINPISAEGGADSDTPDQTRIRAPLSVMAFDRLVSVADYRDFALCFAGIGKATAIRLANVVYVTVAATHSGATSQQSPLYLNLKAAITNNGGAAQEFVILDRRISFLVIFAQVGILPQYEWDSVEKQIRQALFDFFSYQQAQFGATLYLADAVKTIQAVEGVQHVRFKAFEKLDEADLRKGPLSVPTLVNTDIPLQNTQLASDKPVQSAELCFLNPQAPGTLILEPVHHES